MKLWKRELLSRRKFRLLKIREKLFLQVKLFALLLRTLIREKSMVYIFCIPIMLGDAAIFAMPVMPSAEMPAAYILVKSWCRIAWRKVQHTALESCNLTRSLLRTSMHGIFMSGWDSYSLA